MHLKLKDASSEHKSLADLGVGIISGGLGGVAVSLDDSSDYLDYLFILFLLFFFLHLLSYSFALVIFSFGLLFYLWMWQKP